VWERANCVEGWLQRVYVCKGFISFRERFTCWVTAPPGIKNVGTTSALCLSFARRQPEANYLFYLIKKKKISVVQNVASYKTLLIKSSAFIKSERIDLNELSERGDIGLP
jgi:hypothetical protein